MTFTSTHLPILTCFSLMQFPTLPFSVEWSSNLRRHKCQIHINKYNCYIHLHCIIDNIYFICIQVKKISLFHMLRICFILLFSDHNNKYPVLRPVITAILKPVWTGLVFLSLPLISNFLLSPSFPFFVPLFLSICLFVKGFLISVPFSQPPPHSGPNSNFLCNQCC